MENTVVNFEDLVWLFSSNEQSRGIVRLNIAEGALLYKYCRKKRDSAILEIGRKHGGSTVIMASALDKGKLYSVDIVMHDRVAHNIESVIDKVELITGDTEKISWNIPVGLVFIDGDHSYQGVKNDIDLFASHVEIDGYIVFHDVVGKKSILQPLINGLLKKNWECTDKADSMLILRKECEKN